MQKRPKTTTTTTKTNACAPAPMPSRCDKQKMMQQPSHRQTVLLSACSKRTTTRQTTMKLVRTNNNNNCCRWICLQQSSNVTFWCGACMTPFTHFFLCVQFKVLLHFKGSPKACAIKVNCPQQFKFLFYPDARICSAPVRLTACTVFFL